MKKRWRIAAAAALLALVCWCGWYSRPVGVETLFPDLEPDMADVLLIQFDGRNHNSRSLRFSAGTPEFDTFWGQVQSLRFRRSPLSPLVQVMPFLENAFNTSKTLEDGDISNLFIGFAQDNGQEVWRSEELSFVVDAWHYEDHTHGVSLPLMMKNSKETGQELAHTLWEQTAN